MAIIWAQLYVGNEKKGVHAFAVEIRDYNTHLPKPGVILGDCGKKIELEGVDNGFILFKDFKCNYDCLLDYYSQITEEGKFKTSIKNNEKRTGIMLGGLLRGRIACVYSSETTLRKALTIALRFGAVRKQFGEQDKPERSVLTYQSYRFRLMPILAHLFAIRAGQQFIHPLYGKITPTVRSDPESEELSELHAILSCFKVILSKYSFHGIQECRECCGGFGYSAHSGLGRLRNTTDVLLTWEGDNNVLIQQTGKYILKQLQKSFKGVKSKSQTLQFLKIPQESMIWPFETEKDINIDRLISLFECRVCYLAKETIKKLQENAQIYPSMTDS